MSRLSDETPYEAEERVRADQRALLRVLNRIVQGRRGAARVARDRAYLAIYGGHDPEPWLLAADAHEAMAHAAAARYGEMMRGERTPMPVLTAEEREEMFGDDV